MHSERTTRMAGINVVLVILGAVGGALVAIPLTLLGKVVAGAPPATIANYAWNMGVFAMMAAIGAPLLTWSALRRVPLWRAVLEPAAGALAGAAIGALVASGVGFLLLTPIGLGVAAWRLQRAYATGDPPPALADPTRNPAHVAIDPDRPRGMNSARDRAV